MPDESNPPRSADPRARAWVDVDLGALVRNARRVHEGTRVPLVPMVKAQAYGLGAVRVARALEGVEPWGYGLATLAEAGELRHAGIVRPLLIVTPLLASDLAEAAALGVTPSLHRADAIARWAELGGGPWHLSIDTGMARAGVSWDAIDDALLDAVGRHPPEGAFTHFHSADVDAASVARQAARFEAAIARLPSRPPLVHAENSPAVERGSAGGYDLVRPGVYLYGVSLADAQGAIPTPEPVAQLRARIVDLRTMPDGESVSYGATWHARGPRRIATVAAGYADGYRRALSNVGWALVGGTRVPVAGRVTMDMTMLDVTDVACAVGDVATLVGTDGDATLSVAEVAGWGGLSPYELLTGLGLRAPHVYLDP